MYTGAGREYRQCAAMIFRQRARPTVLQHCFAIGRVYALRSMHARTWTYHLSPPGTCVYTVLIALASMWPWTAVACILTRIHAVPAFVNLSCLVSFRTIIHSLSLPR